MQGLCSLSPGIDPVCDMLSPQFDHYFKLNGLEGKGHKCHLY